MGRQWKRDCTSLVSHGSGWWRIDSCSLGCNPWFLSPQEEVATFYAVMIKTDYMQKEPFNRNFWEGFKALLGKGHVIKVGDSTAGTTAEMWEPLVLISEQACHRQCL